MEGHEEVQIMEELPHTLRREIALVVNRKIFERLQLFADFPPRQLRAIANMMSPIKVGAATVLLQDCMACVRTRASRMPRAGPYTYECVVCALIRALVP